MNLIITNTLPFHLEENRTDPVSSLNDTLFPLVPGAEAYLSEAAEVESGWSLVSEVPFLSLSRLFLLIPQVLGGLRVV